MAENCSSKLKDKHEKVAYRQIEEKSHEFLREISNLIIDYEGQLPNLRDIFQPEAIDWLLAASKHQFDSSILDFVINTGYKDEPKVDKDGKPILDRATPIHLVDEDEESLIVPKLFQIYGRFDVNYADESGVTHFHQACWFGCEDEVLKFLEAGQDPNCLTKNRESPLFFALESEHKNVIELLLKNGADPTLANAWGSTPLHIICQNGPEEDFIEMILELCNDKYQPVQVDAWDNHGWTPLQLAMKSGVNCKKLIECLLKNGADPNLANAEGSTPLHIGIEYRIYAFEALEAFFKVTDEINQLVQVDAVDKFGWTPLQLAVAYRLPDVVDLLLDQGADLSSFVFPTASHFRKHFYTAGKNFKLEIASGLLAVVERLENRGYELGRNNALMIMQLFGEYKLFLNNNSASAKCRFEGEQEREAKKTMINPSLSLYDLSQLRPGEASKLLTCSDFLKFVRVDADWNHQNTPSETFIKHFIKHLCEKLSRKFFRRYALDSFLELTCYQLPILCCEIIFEKLSNEDLSNICLAAAGQNTTKWR